MTSKSTHSRGGKKIKAWIAFNPTKYDERYKDLWFDVGDFRIDHKQSLFLKKSEAKDFIENRKNWKVVPCIISYNP